MRVPLFIIFLATSPAASAPAAVSDTPAVAPAPPVSASAAPASTVESAIPPAEAAPAEDDDDDEDEVDEVDEENAAESAVGLQPDVKAGMLELEALKRAEAQAIPDAEALPKHFGRLGPANPLQGLIFDTGHRSGEIYDVPSLEPQGDAGGLLAELGGLDLAALKAEYDIPIEINADVIEYIRFFQGPGRKWYTHWLQRSKRWIPIMRPILAEEGVPLDLVYLAMIESGFSPFAYSWARASGFWQFISATGQRFGLRDDFWLDERRDAIRSTHAAARYLKALHDEMGNWYLAWASYNAGEGKLRHVIKLTSSHDFWEIAHSGGYLRGETRHYVPKLIAAALIAKHPERFGFTDIVPEPAFNYEEVDIPDAMDLHAVAHAAGISFEELQEMNPQLRHWCTPPPHNSAGYKLKVPVGAAKLVASELKLQQDDRTTYRHHVVARGEALGSVAKKFHTSVDSILRANSLASIHQLRAGMDLIVPIPQEYARHIVDTGASWHEPSIGRHGHHSRARWASRAPHKSERPAAPVGQAAAPGSRYVIRSGDTLWSIARRFSVEISLLKRWNGIAQSPHRLQVGRAIYVSPPSARKAGRTASNHKGGRG